MRNRTNTTNTWKADSSFTPDDNGSYKVFVTVADNDDGVGTASQNIAVTNVAPVLSKGGKATFGFVSKYREGASVPTGNTAFQCQVGGLEFYSTAYEWLVVNQAGTNPSSRAAG